jgi:hypothetical protein
VYKLLLCHKRRPTTSTTHFHRHFRGSRAELVRRGKNALGYIDYTQLHQSSRLNPFYQGILLTRSRLVTGVLALLQKLPLLRSKRTDDTLELERWDVVEEFTYPTARALTDALSTGAGTAYCARLVRDQRGVSCLSAVVVGETFQVVKDPAPGETRVKNMFFLRALPALGHDEMLKYWGSEHRQLFAGYQRELRYTGYEQLHVRRSPEFDRVVTLLGGRQIPAFDGVAGVTYAGETKLAIDFISLSSQAANLRLVKDEVRFIDGPMSSLVYGQSQPVDVN